jgi:hypothetical protein
MTSPALTTMDELLSDPLTQSLMKADRVDPARLRADLRQAAARMGERPEAHLPEAWLKRAPDWQRLLKDCVQAARTMPAASLQRSR